MTQPEQEAREMLTEKAGMTAMAEWDRHGITPVIVDAMTSFAARPTAGIDREVTGASLFALWVEAEEARGKEYCSWPDLAGQEMWNFCAETFRRMSLPTAAKTGERGAVIEECARVCDGLFDRATHSDTEAFAYQAAAKAIRALSQPLPDAPIVSGEG